MKNKRGVKQTPTFVLEQFAGDDGGDEDRLVDLQLGLLQIAEELGDDGAESLDTQDREEEVKGLREELEGLGLGTRGDELVFGTLDFHQETSGVEEVLKVTEELLRPLPLRRSEKKEVFYLLPPKHSLSDYLQFPLPPCVAVK